MATENTDAPRGTTASSDSSTAPPMEFDSPPPVIIHDLGLFIKYGRFVAIVEASTQIMI
ncbi:hypothetical protein RB213_009500 [Colletotrichum asianum]